LKKNSISLRLTAWFSAIFLAGFVLFGIVVWIDLAYSLSQGRDRTLTRRAMRFSDLLEATRHDSAQRREMRLADLADVMPEGNLVQIFEPSGKRWFPRTPSPPDFPWPAVHGIPWRQFRTLSYQGRPFLLFQRQLQKDPPLIILVAGQLEDNANLMARFTAGLVWATPIMLLLSASAGYFLSRRVLQPVDQITSALRSISIGSLFQRLPVSPTGDELERLAKTCNEMLARLEDAVGRINRFTADASHELRSPVALIRTVAEFTLRNPRIDVESREAFQEILAESVETGDLIEDMLTLARADAGYADSIFGPVDLAELAEEVSSRLRPLAEAKRQTLIVKTAGTPVWITGDRSSIRRLLSILIDNAIKYTGVEGRISVALRVSALRATLSVADNGIGIPESLQPRIFDRFVRADPSRAEVGGTGLGLAIAKCIANAHHAALSVESREHQGSTFILEFPLATPTGQVPPGPRSYENEPRAVTLQSHS
jgi:heavy metal sensor kinase